MRVLTVSAAAVAQFLKSVWEIHRVVPCVHIAGTVVWFPITFLMDQVCRGGCCALFSGRRLLRARRCRG